MREILDVMLNTKQSDAPYCRYIWCFLDANRRSDNGQLLFDFGVDHRVLTITTKQPLELRVGRLELRVRFI